MMNGKWTTALAAVCFVLAVLAWTPVADSAKGLFAANSDKVDGIHASKTAQAGRLLPLGRNAKFPASLIPHKAVVAHADTATKADHAKLADSATDATNLSGTPASDFAMKNPASGFAHVLADGTLDTSRSSDNVRGVTTGIVFGGGTIQRVLFRPQRGTEEHRHDD